MIKQIKSSEIKEFVENNPKTVLLDVRTEDEWKTLGKPETKDLGIKSFFITTAEDFFLLLFVTDIVEAPSIT